MNKFKIFIYILVFLFAFSCNKKNEEQKIDTYNKGRVIFLFDGKEITENDVEPYIGAYFAYYPNATEEDVVGARKTLANKLMLNLLIEKGLKEKGLEISEEEIALENKKLLFLLKDEFWLNRVAIESNKSVDTVKDEFLDEYKKVKLTCALVPKKLFISETEAKKRYDDNYTVLFLKEERKVVDRIVVDTEKKGARAYKKLLSGENFYKVMNKYSIYKEGDFKSSIGTVTKGTVYGSEIDSIISKIDLNQFSKPQLIEGKYQIFYVSKILPEEVFAFDEIKDNLILYITAEKYFDYLFKYIDEIKKETSIEWNDIYKYSSEK